MSNLITSQVLADISAHGGPRCCKRNVWLALSRAVVFAEEHFGIKIETPDKIVCSHFPRNNECKKEKCLFHPK